MINRLVNNQFSEQPKTQLTQSHSTEHQTCFSTSGHSFQINIQIGCYELSSLKNQIHWAHAFCLVYDIANRSSLEDLKKWKQSISAIFGHDVTFPMLVLGTKSDLESERTVLYYEGLSKSKELDSSLFFEISSKTGDNFRQIFPQFLKEITIFASDFSLGGQIPSNKSVPQNNSESFHSSAVEHTLESTLEIDTANLLNQYVRGLKETEKNVQKANVLVTGVRFF